jgi:hypothetical protein
MPHTESFCSQLLSLPLCPELSFEEQDCVIDAVRAFMSQHSAQPSATAQQPRHHVTDLAGTPIR